jgi:uncharacterized protein YjeT (DUF2065 family)
MKRFLLAYVASYLFIGGIGFLFAPAATLKLFLSNGDYGDVIPRLVGMFMLALAAFVAEFVRRGDLSYYTLTVGVRFLIVVCLVVLYARSGDPLFAVVTGIVLLGLAPSIWVLARERSAKS